jgi:signal transduction histidine kinase
MEGSMRIRSHLRNLVAAGLAGIVIFAAVAFAALRQIEVNGPIYRQIALRQQIVSDYVPPPESLLEIALICNTINSLSDPLEIHRYLDEFQLAQHQFETKFADYMRRMPQGRLKDMMRGTAYVAAEQYLQIAKDVFIPLVQKGDHEGAEKVLLSRMRPLYQQHARAVDEIVAVANQEARDGEALAAKQVRVYTAMMGTVGLLLLLIGGLLSSAIARGISRQTEELQSSFEELRALARRLQSVREEERERLSREIHDQLGQSLTAIKLDVSSLIRNIPEIQRIASAKAASILALVDETIRTVRRIATDLRPQMLDALGLVATIEWAGEEFGARTGMKCRLEIPAEDIEVDPEKATAVFRIFQETLTNVARHAEANEVRARLAAENGDLTLEVSDNGKGIPSEKLSKGRSLGILGMRERVTLLGGDLTIACPPGKGTQVRVRIPLLSNI